MRTLDEKRLLLLGPQLHAATRRLFKSRDEKETRKLFEDTAILFLKYGLEDEDQVLLLAREISDLVAERLETEPSGALYQFVKRVIEYEDWWVIPSIDWSKKRETSQWWELRDELHRQFNLMNDLEETIELIVSSICALVHPFTQHLPSESGSSSTHDLTIQTHLYHRMSGLSEALDDTIEYAFARELKEAGLFTRLRDQLDRNLIVASGGDLRDPSTFDNKVVMPTRVTRLETEALIQSYLGSTPLLDFVRQKVPFTIPAETRFEHMHIVAGSGHGKSQTLQYLIAQDLEAVADGKRSVVVMDSQGDLINNIRRLKLFAPGEPLHDRIVIIDPTDVAYPVSLNLFDIGQERLSGYEPLERERLQNSILELYDFVLGSLLDAGMTQKQSVIFRYVTRLMLHIDNATIHTLVELMEEDSHEVFADDIAKLSGTAKRFFETEFTSKEFTQTRKQVLRRLWGILENQTFERMFTHPKSKLDLFGELNAGKVILINTAKDLLKESGTQIFGRFFIALIAQAAQERATLPANKRLPTHAYIDEASDYFDRNIGIILSQARKYNVGMTLAHQYLGQLDPKLQEAFGANTSIKFAGGVSAKDARALAPMLYCDASLIERQPKGSFAGFARGTASTALPLQFPFGHMEAMERMTGDEAGKLRDLMRERYAMPIGELNNANTNKEDDGAAYTSKEAETADTEPTNALPNNETPKSDGDVSIEPGEEW